jgi:hypothetical protein
VNGILLSSPWKFWWLSCFWRSVYDAKRPLG